MNLSNELVREDDGRWIAGAPELPWMPQDGKLQLPLPE